MLLKRIMLDGFGSYRDRCELDLSDVRAAAIVGDNGAGKSTIPDALLWTLFGDTPNRSAGSVLNSEVDEARTGVRFVDADGNEWKVRRNRVRSGRTAVRAKCSNGLDITGAKEVAQVMAQTLGCDAAVLCVTAMARQGDAGLFATGAPSLRREILLRGMPRIEFSTMLEKSQQHEQVASDRAVLTRADVDRNEELADKAGPRREALRNAERDAAAADKLATDLEAAMSDGQSSGVLEALREARQAARDLEAAEGALESATRARSQAIKRAERHDETINELEQEHEQAKEALKSAVAKEKAAAENAAIAEAAAANAPDVLRLLEAAEATCFACGGDLTDDQRTKQAAEMMTLLEAAETTKQNVAHVSAAARSARKAVDRAHHKVTEAKQAAANERQSADRAKTAIEQAQTRIEHYSPLAAKVEDLETAAADETDHNEKAARLGAAKNDRRVANERVGAAQAALAEAERANEMLPGLKETALEAETDKSHAELLVQAMRPSGVPQVAMEQRCNKISRVTNLFLSEMSEMELRFVADDEGPRGGMTISMRPFDAEWRQYRSFSGGERMRADVALRMALCQVLGVRVDLRVFDEGFGALDHKGTSQFGQLCNQIVMNETVKQLFAITHVSAVADAFSHLIEVTKQGGTSVARVSAV